MATPIGHALAGVVAGAVAGGRGGLVGRAGGWRELAVFAALSQVPDLDFIPGILVGRPSLFHHGISHSLGAAVLFGLVVGAVGWWKGGRKAGLKWGWIAAVMYGVHVIVDYWTMDPRPPIGLPLWWPVNHEYVLASHPVLLNIKRELSQPGAILHDLKAVGLEIALLGPPAALAGLLRARIGRKA